MPRWPTWSRRPLHCSGNAGPKKSGDTRRRELSDLQTLRDAELLVDGDQVSYAALILFGTRTGLTRWLAQAELVF